MAGQIFTDLLKLENIELRENMNKCNSNIPTKKIMIIAALLNVIIIGSVIIYFTQKNNIAIPMLTHTKSISNNIDKYPPFYKGKIKYNNKYLIICNQNKAICLNNNNGDIFELYKTFGGNLDIKFNSVSIKIGNNIDNIVNSNDLLGFELENNKLQIWAHNKNLAFYEWLSSDTLYRLDHGNGVTGIALITSYNGPLQLDLIDI
jgi:hypothetical protein